MNNPNGGDDEILSEELEEEVLDAGCDLLDNKSSVTVDKLLNLIEKVESTLVKVGQLRPRNASALLPIMTALITDEVLRHTNVNIQIAVACCMNELIRITAPEAPYDPKFMEVIFPLFMVALKQLSSESANDYSIPLSILETVAPVKTCLLMMDYDCEEIVVEMFQLFLDTIRSDHPVDTFKYMKIIMTTVITESDEVSFELLKPLLLSARLENKNISPLSWKLAITVIQKCARKLQPYVRAAVQKMNQDIDDYPEIVISLCQDTSKGRNMLEKEVLATISKIDRHSKDDQEVCAPGINDSNENVSENKKSSQTLSFDSEETHVAEIDQPEMDKGTIHRRRGKKPTRISQNEGYDPFCPGESSLKERNPVNGVSHKKGPSQKGIVINEDNNQEWSSSIRKKILQTKVKMRGSSSATKKGKRVVDGSSYSGAEEKEGILREEKLKLIREERNGKKRSSTIQKQESNDAGNKKVVSSSGKPPKTKNQKNLSKEKGKKPGRSLVDYGEELVNLRIQVWWPMDKIFYSGIVEAFDPVTSKHTILYDDNERENLNLKKQKWQLLNDKLPQEAQSSQEEKAEYPSPAKEPVKSQEKTTKRKRGSSNKQHTTSSSQSLKSERQRVVISGQSSAEETRETDVSPMYDGENHAGKEQAGMSRDQGERDGNELENLKKERWQLLNAKLPQEAQSSQKEEAEYPTPAKDPLESQEKTAKRQRGSSSKQHGTSSSKRLKIGSRDTVISGQRSAHVIDDPEETRETRVSPKYDGEIAGKEEAGTSRDKSDQDVTKDTTTNP